MNKEQARTTLQKAFAAAVGECDVQDGWPCGTCFQYTMRELGLTSEEAHAMWLLQLSIRNPSERGDTYIVRVEATAAGVAHKERIRKYQESLHGGSA